MHDITLLIAIVLCAIAIIGVIIWRLKPGDSGETGALRMRVGELTGQLQAQLQKGDAQAAELRTLSADLAARTAGIAASETRFAEAANDRRQARADCERLQAELDQSRSVSVRTQAERAAAVEALDDVRGRYSDLQRRFDELTVQQQSALHRASTSEQVAREQDDRIGALMSRLEITEAELRTAQINLVEAVAKHETDESAARYFENVGQKVLADTLEQAKKGMTELAAAFKDTSAGELTKHAASVSKTLEPLQAKLQEYEKAIDGLRKDSTETYGGLKQQIAQLQLTEKSLHDQARALTTALSASPKMRGSYGELQLKQLVEFAGMQQHTHFETQVNVNTEEGRKIPDMVVNLPEGQKVLVDAKAVMEACVQALQATDDAERTVLLKRHCDHVRSRILDLSSKNYFRDHENAVEVVVLFLPAEHLYNAAMENDPDLTQFAAGRNIIVCGPNSLLMLLKVANTVWRRAAIEDEHKKIVTVGNEIYEAACNFVMKYATVGQRINSLTNAYNDAAGTLDGRLIPSGRKMANFEAISSAKEMADPPALTENARNWRSDEARKELASMTMLELPITADLSAATA